MEEGSWLTSKEVELSRDGCQEDSGEDWDLQEEEEKETEIETDRGTGPETDPETDPERKKDPETGTDPGKIGIEGTESLPEGNEAGVPSADNSYQCIKFSFNLIFYKKCLTLKQSQVFLQISFVFVSFSVLRVTLFRNETALIDS